MSGSNGRIADHPIEQLFLDRWSPRAFTDEPIPDAVLFRCLEAARWAPSSYNSQPWRFIYAKRDSVDWTRFLGFLSTRNQVWAKTAAVLLVMISAKDFTPSNDAAPVELRSHAFDAGAAWAHFALQATASGWHAHGIGGFDEERARKELELPDRLNINAMAAVGRQGHKSLIPEKFHASESPNGRMPIETFAFSGRYPATP